MAPGGAQPAPPSRLEGGVVVYSRGGLAVFSDRLVVGQFLGPICLAVVGLAFLRAVSVRKGVETIVLGGAAYGCALGMQFLVGYWPLRTLSVGLLTDLSKSKEAYKRLLVDMPSYFQQQYLVLGVLCTLLALAPMVALCHIVQTRRQRRAVMGPIVSLTNPSWRPQAATAALVAAAWLGCVCTVAALVVSGVGRCPGSDRYLLSLLFIPFLFLPVCLRFLPGRPLQRLGQAIPLFLVLFAVYQMTCRHGPAPRFAFRDLRQPYPEVCQTLDRLANEGKIHRGLATYWNARKHQYLCREHVQIKAIFADGTPWLHLQNPNGFLAPDCHCLEVPRYDFILLNDQELAAPTAKADLCRLFGSPREQGMAAGIAKFGSMTA